MDWCGAAVVKKFPVVLPGSVPASAHAGKTVIQKVIRLLRCARQDESFLAMNPFRCSIMNILGSHNSGDLFPRRRARALERLAVPGGADLLRGSPAASYVASPGAPRTDQTPTTVQKVIRPTDGKAQAQRPFSLNRNDARQVLEARSGRKIPRHRPDRYDGPGPD